MKIITPILFQLLIRYCNPDLVCDIGSMDGSDALRFRKDLPYARILAFEANPKNVELMLKNKLLKEKRIEIQHKAVWNTNGIVNFYVEKLSDLPGEEWRRGISSTRKREKSSLGRNKVSVSSIRLDTFVKNLKELPNKIGLWIDVEGVSFEVVEGISQIKDKVLFIHVEVENKEIWIKQKLSSDVIKLMKEMGFFLLARGFGDIQDNIVFINSHIYSKAPIKYRIILLISFILSQFYKRMIRIFDLAKFYMRIF